MKSTITLETKSKVIKYTVDWNDLPDYANYIAIDRNGEAWWYIKKPIAVNCEWQYGYFFDDSNKARKIDDLHGIVINWNETLIERPQSCTTKSKDTMEGGQKYHVGDRFAVNVFGDRANIVEIEEVIESEKGFLYKLSCETYYRTEEAIDKLNMIIE